jgi:hypothetical protein
MDRAVRAAEALVRAAEHRGGNALHRSLQLGYLAAVPPQPAFESDQALPLGLHGDAGLR